MSFFMNTSDLIKSFAVPFSYKPYFETKTRAREVKKGYGDEVKVNEALVPFNQGDTPTQSGQTSRNMFTFGGQVVTADWVWYSNHLDVVLNSHVYYHGQTLVVIASDDYSGYSDMKIYYLKGQTGLTNE